MRLRGIGWVVLLGMAGCSAGRLASWEKGVDVSKKGDDSAAVAQGDKAWAERGNEARLRAAIAAWEQAAAQNPSNGTTQAKLARAYYLLADGHLSFLAEKDEAKKKEMLDAYERGVQAAERGLLIASPEFAREMRAGKKMLETIPLLGKEAVPALYWYATNLGKWARAKGLTTAIAHKKNIFASIEKVFKLDRDYFYAGPDRYFGSYYAFLSSIMGGDKKKSKAHFDHALQVAPNAFATKVLMADLYYGKRMQNRPEFERLLKEVINGNPDALPELGPENRIEQKKAQDLLRRVEDIF
jgi:tetratricopeptide (TPR) repeat protein